MIYLKSAVISGIVLMCSTAAAFSQSTGTAARDELVNAYVAPYTLLDDHPECSGPGQLAFRTELNAPGFAFYLRDIGTGKQFDGADDGDIMLGEEECTVKTRRGVDVFEIPIACPDDTSSSPAQDIEYPKVQAKFRGHVIACMSVAQFHVLEGAWSVDFETTEGMATQSGASVSLGHAPNTLQTTLPTAKFEYSFDGFDLSKFKFESSRSDDPDPAQFGATSIRVDLRCIPMEAPFVQSMPGGGAAGGLVMAADLVFTLHGAGAQDCKSSYCVKNHTWNASEWRFGLRHCK